MIESFLKYLRFEKRYSQHTLLAYENDLAQFSDFGQKNLDLIAIDQATHLEVRAWVVFMVDQGISNRSVNRKIASIRAYFKFLLRREAISVDPTRKIKSLKLSRKLPSFVKEDDMLKVLDQVEFTDDFYGKRDQLVMELLYGTGIRLSELIELTYDSIDFIQGSIKVLGKRNKERIIPMAGRTTELIKTYQKKQTETYNTATYLVVTDSGEKAYPMLIYRIVKKYLNLFVTIDKKSPHVLRHTYATHLLNKGADLNAVKDLLGHASLAATQVYTHNSIEKLKNVFDQAHPKA